MTRTQWVHRSFVDDQDDDDPERPPVSSLASRSTYGHDESVESSVSYPTNVNTAILLANRTTNVFTLTAAWRPYVLHAWLATGPARRPELAADHVTWTRQLSLISQHNTSNKGQLSKTLNSQLLKKELQTATSKCHSKRSVCHSKESAFNNAINRILLSLCSYVKICALTSLLLLSFFSLYRVMFNRLVGA